MAAKVLGIAFTIGALTATGLVLSSEDSAEPAPAMAADAFLAAPGPAQEKGQANHIHFVWRDFKGDWGRDVLAEHYLTAPHHADARRTGSQQ